MHALVSRSAFAARTNVARLSVRPPSCAVTLSLSPFVQQSHAVATLVLPPVSASCFSSSSSGAEWPADAVRPALTMFSEEERMLADATRKFAEEYVAPLVTKQDSSGQLEPSLLKNLFEHGMMGIEIPDEYGGTAMSFTQSIIAIQELAKVDPAIAVIVDIQNTLINKAFMTFASQPLKEKYLPRLATDTLASFCLSEPGCGSDAFAMTSTATKSGDTWTLNGTKMWISNAKEAGLFLVFANADPSMGYKGITAFAVDAGTPGLDIGKKEDKLGIRASSTCELLLNDVKVPESAVVGEVGKGYKIAIGLLNEGRIGIAAQMLGLAEGVFEATMPYLFQRKAFGQFIGDFQGMKFGYAQAFTDIEKARLLIFNAARLQENKQPFVAQAAMAKLEAARVAESVASQCIEFMGGVGYTKEFPHEKFFRDSKIGAIYEGSANLQLQTIANILKKDYE